MKKFLTILTVVALLIVQFTFSASADTYAVCDTCKKDHVVGNVCSSTGAGDYTDGVPNFTDTPVSGEVVLQLKGIESRYAVDVVFGTLSFNFGDVSRWNVNTLKYETTASEDPKVLVTVEVVNYSDNPVYTKVVPTFTARLSADTELMELVYWNSSARDGKGTIEDHIYYGVVPSAATTSPNPATDRSRVELSLCEPGTTNWQNVANELKDHIDAATQTITLGTITVTVSMNSLRP